MTLDNTKTLYLDDDTEFLFMCITICFGDCINHIPDGDFCPSRSSLRQIKLEMGYW